MRPELTHVRAYRCAKDNATYADAVDVIRWIRQRGVEAVDAHDYDAAVRLANVANRLVDLFMLPGTPLGKLETREAIDEANGAKARADYERDQSPRNRGSERWRSRP